MTDLSGPRFRYFFDFFEEIKRANAAYLAAQGINIPESITNVTLSTCNWPAVKPETKCWDCGSTVNLSHKGIHAYCGGCLASMRQEYRKERAED